MRAVRSVINAAGRLITEATVIDENQLLLRALLDVNMPKFLTFDLPLFSNIIKDLFPTTENPVIDYGRLSESILVACKACKVIDVPIFLEKVIQLYDTIQVRHGLMLVGPAGGGKTKDI